jgi:hypothetical protein
MLMMQQMLHNWQQVMINDRNEDRMVAYRMYKLLILPLLLLYQIPLHLQSIDRSIHDMTISINEQISKPMQNVIVMPTQGVFRKKMVAQR